jgi:hypothetical protein
VQASTSVNGADRGQPRRFGRLSILRTSSSYWDQEPVEETLRIGQLFAFLLDPSADGLACLGEGVRGPGGGVDWSWTVGAAAIERVQARVAAWVPIGAALQMQQINHNRALSALVDGALTVVLDQARLRDCLAQLGVSNDLRNQGICLRLVSDWSMLGQHTVLWAPQAAAMNYWPDDPGPRLQPAPAEPPPSSAAAAGDVLEDKLLPTLQAFEHVRLQFVGRSFKRIGPGRVEPPLFYVARPTASCSTPEEFLEDAGLREIQALARRPLGTRDIRSTEVAGSLVEGSVLALRRESFDRETLWTYYLLVACEDTDVALAGNTVNWVADRLAWHHDHSAYEVYDIVTDLEAYRRPQTVWEVGGERARELVDDLFERLASLDESQRANREETFRSFGKLRSAFLRLDSRCSTAPTTYCAPRLAGIAP